ncbi:MAG: NfeD family protein [Planctomycetota bacterium]|jgi:membrane-bound serine protease (ClpP class)
MRNSCRKVAIFLLSALLASALIAEPNEPSSEVQSVEAVVIICKDMIDDGLYKSIQRRVQAALDEGVEYIIFDVDTFGGALFAAYNISEYLLHEVNQKAHTVAYVSKKAISAGALISVACEDIIMKEKTRIGDCAPIALGGKLEGVEREKIETDTRAAFVTSAKANNYPEALLKAMVTQQIEVYRIINKSTGEGEFFESARMPQDPNEYNLKKKELIVSKDELLTLTASEAFDYGIARAVVKERQGVLDYLTERDGVIFSGQAKILRTNWSEEMVRKINHPAVMSILIMIALLGVYIEFNTPGVGLPGLAAVICFTIIIGSKYLVGLANWAEVAVFIIGVILLMVEIFIIPGFGITGILGIILMVGGLFGMLIRNGWDEVPWPRTEFDWYLFSQSILGLAIGFIGFIVLAWAITKYLPKFEFMSGLILIPATPKKGDEFEISMTIPPESKIGSVQVGDVGEVTSILRPAGKVQFGEAVVDCVAEADFLDKGSKVEIIEIHGNKVIVRSVKDQ